jgi:branched-chain amino acid transport system permease protein
MNPTLRQFLLSPRTHVALLAAAAAALVATMGVDYTLGQLAFVATFAIAGLGVVLIVGHAGQISLGQGALLALGAYTQGILARHGVPAPLSVPLAVAVAGGGGWLAALPARRLGGLYFAMSTLAFALIVEEVLVRASPLTGGAAGLTVPTLTLGSLAADSAASEALVSTAVLALAWFACRRWVDSRLGRAWRAVRADEGAAAANGIDCLRAKSAAFAIGGGLSGLAGALYAHWIGFLSPEQFGLMLSFELLMLAFIGGARHLAGALWGALVIVAIPQIIAVLRDLLPGTVAATAGLELLLFGLVLVAVVLWRPQGLAGK